MPMDAGRSRLRSRRLSKGAMARIASRIPHRRHPIGHRPDDAAAAVQWQFQCRWTLADHASDRGDSRRELWHESRVASLTGGIRSGTDQMTRQPPFSGNFNADGRWQITPQIEATLEGSYGTNRESHPSPAASDRAPTR